MEGGGAEEESEKIRREVADSAWIIADSLRRGKDVEIRKSRDGISVAEVAKKVVRRHGIGKCQDGLQGRADSGRSKGC